MKKSIFVITAPSGTGKTTLNRRLVKECGNIELSVSYTTRPRRSNEINGDHYWFVDQNVFDDLIAAGKMLEWAEVFGHTYGTCIDELKRIQDKGKHPLLEIDVQGWRQVKTVLPEALSVFILPPSMKILWDRLQKRGTDTLETRLRRIHSAKDELNQAALFDYFIINDDMERAYNELKVLVTQRIEPSLKREHGARRCLELCQELENVEWLKSLT